jgi:Transcriptional regulator, AbiEi antitoxin
MNKKALTLGRLALPAAFTYTQARAAGISAERLYAYRDQGLIDQVARGLYRWADAPEIDQDLLEVAHRAPRTDGHYSSKAGHSTTTR